MNPRRPTPSGPKPDPFDLARAPPPIKIINMAGKKHYYPKILWLLVTVPLGYICCYWHSAFGFAATCDPAEERDLCVGLVKVFGRF